MRKILLFLVVIATISACAGISKSELKHAKLVQVSKEEFAQKPFPIDSFSLQSFQSYYKKVLKTERYFVENSKQADQRDTIFRLHQAKTKILFYKPANLPARIMAGSIVTPKIILKNNIRVGMTKNDFFWQFSDWPHDVADEVSIFSPQINCNIYFLFKNNRLKEILLGNKRN